MNPRSLSNIKQTKASKTLDFGSLSLTASALCRYFMEQASFTPLLKIDIPTMAEAIGKCEKTTWSAKLELIELDIIRYRRYNPGSNLYWINPEFTNNASWHSVLNDWFDAFPYFNSILSGVSSLISRFYPENYEPRIKNKDNTLDPICASVSTMAKLEKEGEDALLRCDPGSQLSKMEEKIPPKRDDLVTMDNEAAPLVDKLRKMIETRTGKPLRREEYLELYAFPSDAVEGALSILRHSPNHAYPKALVWESLRKITGSVAGRFPDFEKVRRLEALDTAKAMSDGSLVKWSPAAPVEALPPVQYEDSNLREPEKDEWFCSDYAKHMKAIVAEVDRDWDNYTLEWHMNDAQIVIDRLIRE